MNKKMKSIAAGILIAVGLVANAQATIYTTTFTINSLIDDNEFGSNSEGLGFLPGAPTSGNFATLAYNSNTNAFTVSANSLDNFFGAGVYIDAVVFETEQSAGAITAGSVTQPSYSTPDITSISEFTSETPNFTAAISNFDVGYSFNNGLHDNQQVTFIVNGFNANCLTANSSACAVNTNLLSQNAFALRLRNGNNDNDNVSYFLGVSIDPASAVPEPQTYAMFLMGLGLLGFMSKRKNMA